MIKQRAVFPLKTILISREINQIHATSVSNLSGITCRTSVSNPIGKDCYLVNSFALLLAPSFAAAIFPAVLMPAFVGELALTLWLIVTGVNMEQWRQRVPQFIGSA